MSASRPDTPKDREVSNRSIWIGGIFTAVWLAGGFAYFWLVAGWGTLATAKFNEIGDLLAGFSAPLGFLWFVIALFHQKQQIAMQAEELSLQREELQETRKTLEAQRDEMAEAAKQAKAQADALEASMEIQRYQHISAKISASEHEMQNLLNKNIGKFFPYLDINKEFPLSSQIPPYMCVEFFVDKIEFLLNDRKIGWEEKIDIIIKSGHNRDTMKRFINIFSYTQKLHKELNDDAKFNSFMTSEYKEIFINFSYLLAEAERKDIE